MKPVEFSVQESRGTVLHIFAALLALAGNHEILRCSCGNGWILEKGHTSEELESLKKQHTGEQ